MAPDCCAKKLLAFFGDPLCFLACADSPATVDAPKTPSTYSMDDVNEEALKKAADPASNKVWIAVWRSALALLDAAVQTDASLTCGNWWQMPEMTWDTQSQPVLCGDGCGICDHKQLMTLCNISDISCSRRSFTA